MQAKRIVTALLVAVLVGQFAAPASAQLPPNAMSAAELNTLFNTYGDAGGHWTGGDGTASVALPDGRVVWLFADSFLGTVNADHSRPTNSPFVNNLMVIQDGTGLTSTLHGGTPEAPAALVKPEQEGEIYWVADGVVEGTKLKVIYNRIRTTGSGALDFYQTGVALATFSLPGLALESVVDLPLGPKIGWGGGIFPDGEYTYIYGISSAPGRMKFAHLARVPAGGLSGPWEFWTGSAWSPHVDQVGRLISGVDAGGVQKVGSQYVWVTHENNLVFDPQIVAYTSTSPTGPFTGPIPLFTAPEPQTNGLIIYDVRVHPELARSGKLLVSYNVNNLNPGGTYADVRHGRPRFIEVDWPRPATPGVPAAPGAPAASGQDTAVTVSWPAVSGATSYRVYQKDVTGGQTHFARLPQVPTGTSVQAGLLVPGHAYEYKVTAVNAAGEGPFSPVATVTPRSTKPVTEAVRGSRSPAAITGSYIVELTDATPVHNIADYARALVAETGGTLRGVLTHALHGFGAILTEEQAIDLASHPDVQAVEQELRATLDDGGTQEPAPGHLDRLDQRDLPLDNKYVFPNAGTDVRAYVVDTGVRGGDPEFVNQIAPGHNAIDDSANTEDCPRGHGTMVAGVVGSLTYGVAKDVAIVPVKVGTCDGEGKPEVGFYGIYKGLDWVIADSFDKRPAVVNLSFGMPVNEHGAGFVQKAVRKALDNGLTVVTSAGNDNGDACAYSPNRLSRETPLITVGAIDGLDRRWSRSNQGPCVDLFAVGEGVLTVGPSSTQVVAVGNGTSMSAPAVTGAAAILLHEHPEYSPEEVKRALLAAATTGRVKDLGAGTPNRLLYIGPAPTHAPENLTATPKDDGTIELDWDPVPETDVHYLVYSRNVTLGEEELNEWDDPVFESTSAVFRDGQEGHTYEFRVAAANGADTGPQSLPARATVNQAPPAPATNLTATSQADGTIRLTWTSSAPGLWHYVYLRDLDADPPQEQPARLEWPVSEGNSTTLGWLTHGHEYEMYVTAIGPGGESAPSNLARATATFPLPSGPSNLAGTAGDRNVTLTWQSAGEAVWYWVEMRNVTAGEPGFTRLELPVSTCCTFHGGDLANGTTYEFRVRAIGADGGPDSAPSNTVRLTPVARPADPPTGLVAEAGNAQAMLTWTAPDTQPEAWYWVEQRPAGGTWQRLGLPISTCCSFVSTGLTNGTTYEFRVVTLGANGAPDSTPSNVASARLVAPPVGAPSNLRATAGNARVDLTWTASSTPGAWYWVEQRTAGGTWQRLALPISTCCAFASTGLTNGTTYEFRVVTAGANGAPDSAPSNVASARPVAPQPAAPTNLRATAGNARVDLTWTASTTPNSWYWIEMRNASKGQSWQRISAPDTTCCTFASTGLTNGDTYEYRVRTAGGGGAPDSAPSNVVSARPVAPRPGAPTNLTATAGNAKVTLRWTASTTSGAWYWVYYRNASRGQAWQKVNAPITTCCTYVSAYLSNGDTYEYKVAAIGGGGAPDSPFSNTVSARPMPPMPQAPSNLRASPGDNEAYLSWNASPTPGVVYYMHYRVNYGNGYGAWQRTAFPALTTSMTAGYMTYGWTYEYRIVASNMSGESAPSNVVSVLIVPYSQRRKCASVTSNWALGGRDAVQLYDITTSMCAERSNFTFRLDMSWSSRVKVREAAWFWRLVDCYSGKEIARYGIGYPAPGTDLRSQSAVTYYGLKPGKVYRFTLEGWGKLTGHIGEETRFSPFPDGHVGIIPHSAATDCF